ncbi:MAG: hypothetical protein J0M17_20185 [Planctomycetes bacterium]|nr:hypothetical protein [Planctomycetota bacterium]
MKHYYRAKHHNTEAAKVINKPGLLISREDGLYIREQQRLAISEAKLVKDEVLAKAHPDLPKHWREEFQRGLELEVDGGSITGQLLIGTFVDWANRERSNFRVPKGISSEIDNDGTSITNRSKN